jgi:thioredoxin 1
MTRIHRLLSIVAALGLAGTLTLALTGCDPATKAEDTAAATMPRQTAPPPAAAAPVTTATEPAPLAGKRLPRLVDIGSGTCIPCRMMKPILEELVATRADQFETVFVDLGKDRAEAMRYSIYVIPTQVFFDGDGRELHRHEGFMSKEQILDVWKQLGYDFGG